jgi:hypothetical protein
MALDSGVTHPLLAQEQYKVGRIGDHFIQAVFQAIYRLGPATRALAAAYTRIVISGATSTAQTVKASAGTVFRVRIENLSASAIVVDLLDGTVQKKRQFCPARVSATVPSCAEDVGATDTVGIGTEYTTSINCKAFLASDGTTTAAAGVTVFVDIN